MLKICTPYFSLSLEIMLLSIFLLRTFKHQISLGLLNSCILFVSQSCHVFPGSDQGRFNGTVNLSANIDSFKLNDYYILLFQISTLIFSHLKNYGY